MNPHTEIGEGELEQRLRREAGRLLPQEDAASRASFLVSTHRQRKRKRLTVGFAGLALLLGVGVGVWSLDARSTSPSQRFARSEDREQPLNLQTDTAPQLAEGQPNEDALPPGFQLPEPPSGLPLVVSLADGSEVVVTGYYVPEQVEDVQFDELSFSEQNAVIRLIGYGDQQHFGPF